MTITPALLQRKDLFRLNTMGAIYRVSKIEGYNAHYVHVSSDYGGKDGKRISIKSRAKIILVEDGDFQCPPEDLHKHFKILPEGTTLVPG